MVKALEHANRSVSLIENIVGKKQENGPEIKNYLLSQRLQTLGDIYREMGKEDISEKTYQRC